MRVSVSYSTGNLPCIGLMNTRSSVVLPLGFGILLLDDGIGLSSSFASRGGLGPPGMRERVQALDGHFIISSQWQSGTTIKVQIPIGIPA